MPPRLGSLQCETGEPTQALASSVRGRDLLEPLVRDHPTVTEYQDLLARACSLLGTLQRDLKQRDEALRFSERALALIEKLVHENPGDTDFRYRLGLICHGLGAAQLGFLRIDEGLRSFGRSQEVFEQLARDQPAVLKYRNELARSHHSIAAVQHFASVKRTRRSAPFGRPGPSARSWSRPSRTTSTTAPAWAGPVLYHSFGACLPAWTQ